MASEWYLRGGNSIGAVAVLLANTSGRSDTLYVWRLRLPAGFEAKPVWHEQPAQKADLELLRSRLRQVRQKCGFRRRLTDQLRAMELYENPSPKK